MTTSMKNIEAAPGRSHAVAPRNYSDAELKRRMEMNQGARFGLETATRDQLNVIFILCKRWRLDPITDITLFEGKPWITIDGYLRLAREHPEYLGHEQRPLSEAEKQDGGWPAGIVWATTIRTRSWGDITQWGKVTEAEIAEAQGRSKSSGKRAAPVGVHPVEIAQKRSFARAYRYALGLDMPTEEEIEAEITAEIAERTNPEKVKADAAAYDRAMDAFSAEPPALQAPDEEPTHEVLEERDLTPWERNRMLTVQAENMGLRPKTLAVSTPEEAITAYNDELAAQMEQTFFERNAKDARARNASYL